MSLSTAALAFVVLAIVVQTLVERIKDLLPKKISEFISSSEYLNIGWISLAVALVVCFSTKLDIFELLQIESKYKVLNYIFTAVLISGGSGFINDLIKSIQGLKKDEASIAQGIEFLSEEKTEEVK